MDWNHVERLWTQTKSKIQEKWAKLTDDDLEVINGQRDRYGFAPDHVRKEVDDWARWQMPVRPHGRSRSHKSEMALR
jgi:uncharacterized protein YjbJ (UPF0337 family)